jgi:hypothetical protein
MYLIIIEPNQTLHRYAQTARHRYETLVVTDDVTACLERERASRHSAGLKEGTDIDRIVECNTKDPAAILDAIENFRGEVAAVVAGHEAALPVATQLSQRLGCGAASLQQV